MSPPGGRLRRLLAPRHIAFVGGDIAVDAIRQCRRLGFDGAIWPVHPSRGSMDGIPCHRSVDALPEAPDAAFVAVPEEPTIEVVAALAGRGAGGAVCHASGFAEASPSGRRLQDALVHAAGDLPVVGPNCLGIINYLDRVALWPEQHGGRAVDRGVAIVTQSGNIGQNLTMQRRALPIGQLVTVGNGVTDVPEIVDALLDDQRVTAIGLHLEGVDDPVALARTAVTALRRRIPIVVLKTGTSELGARTNLSHTSSLAGSDALADALFERVGMARVRDVETFLETLKYLHVHGCQGGSEIASASCSGGEATLVADAAHRHGLRLPDFQEPTRDRLRSVLGDRVAVANPLDYHTYVWGDADRLATCFEAFLGAGVDAHLLVLDVPRDDRCRDAEWHTTIDAFVAAHRRTAAPACVVSTLPEGLPDGLGERLLSEGIAAMQGLESCLTAIERADWIGRVQRCADRIDPLPDVRGEVVSSGPPLSEYAGKQILAEGGVRVPAGAVATADGVADVARSIGFPVVAKVASGLVHKSDADGVRLGLDDQQQLADAVAAMCDRADAFLIEQQVDGAVAELIVGVQRDPQYGLALTVGTGGVLVELLRDTATLLIPTSRSQIRSALRTLRGWPLLTGFRGRKPADVDAVLDTVQAVARYAYDCRDCLVELEINPLLVLPEGQGAVAADVVIRYGDDTDRKESARGPGPHRDE